MICETPGLEVSDAERLIRNAKTVCWDFDGVIKDSVAVKTEAYADLFADAGASLSARVRAHHEAHGGMSRFEKIPLYLSWTGDKGAAATIDDYCARFSERVLTAVIESPWVPGVESYIRRNAHAQRFFLITATPLDEIETILEALSLREAFAGIYGAPMPKAQALARVLIETGDAPADVLMVGDARSDLDAASANGVPFLLRRTGINSDLIRIAGTSFGNLRDG